MTEDAPMTTAHGRTAWFHCFAGTAGDMTLASLVHAGADPVAVAAIVAGLPLDDYALTFEPVMRCGIPTSLIGAQNTPRMVNTISAKDSVAAIPRYMKCPPLGTIITTAMIGSSTRNAHFI